MLSKSVERLVNKLAQKKQRYLHKMFVAEGQKTIEELILDGLEPVHLLVSDDRFSDVASRQQLSTKDFGRISKLDQADGTLAVFPFPELEDKGNQKLVLVLDRINIPGNLGTLIRTADWFGIKHIYCVQGTTDAYNAKCVQSSMGSIGRVKLTYDSSENILVKLTDRKLYCADMEGESLKNLASSNNRPMALVLGSESHGPDAFWKKHATAITIDRAPDSKTESLNVGIAGAILMQHLS
jgi:TrmH family RNA methyltransferase